MQEKEKLLEVDLWKPVSDFFVKQGFTVRSEVKDCDITAVKDEKLIIVELKRNLTVELLAQGVKRQKAADLVYIAVPKPKRLFGSSKWKDIYHLLRRLELGLILVSFKGKTSFIEVAIAPMAFDREKSRNINKKKRENIIEEINGRYEDLNVGGSRGRKLVTAYRESSIFIACCLNELGPLSPKKLREFGTDEKKTTSILYENHYGWFDKVDKGVYKINSTGREALETYRELAEYYYGRISNK